MAHHYLVQVSPADQPLPILFGSRRYNNHHGGRLVVVKRQALKWSTRKAAEKWLQIEQSTWGDNPLYGRMTYTVIEDGTIDLPLPEELLEYIFVDQKQHRVVLPADSTEAAVQIARLHHLKVLEVKYRIARQQVLGDYRHTKEKR